MKCRISFRSLLVSLVLPVLAFASVALAAPAPAEDHGTAPNGVARLMEGNQRFAAGRMRHHGQDEPRRRELAAGQKPFAVVVSCSDSRVPPELVFDQGLGDLFVVRTAGHVVDPVAMGSVEFAVAKLGARTILVLGHERCGAVQAALEHTEVPGSIGQVLADIQPVVGGPTKATPEALDHAVQQQVLAVAAKLRESSPVLTPYLRDRTLEVAGAVYDLDSGRITAVAPGASR